MAARSSCSPPSTTRPSSCSPTAAHELAVAALTPGLGAQGVRADHQDAPAGQPQGARARAGRRSTLLRARALRLPRVHVSSEIGSGQKRRPTRQLLPGDLRRCRQSDSPHDQTLATAPAKRGDPWPTSLKRSNPIVRGWINYYGRFYRSQLLRSLDRINEYLMRWAMRKYKRLRRRPLRAWELVAAAHQRQPELFAHWPTAATPARRMMGAG